MPAGTKLADEFVLAAQLRVGRTTLREAVLVLVDEGWLEVRRGIGTFVARRAAPAMRGRLDTMSSMTAAIAAIGARPGVRDLHVREVAAQAEVAEMLEMAPGTMVARIGRTRLTDDPPGGRCRPRPGGPELGQHRHQGLGRLPPGGRDRRARDQDGRHRLRRRQGYPDHPPLLRRLLLRRGNGEAGCQGLEVYSGTFTGPAAGKEYALAQVNQHADIVFAVAGATSAGVIVVPNSFDLKPGMTEIGSPKLPAPPSLIQAK